MNFDSLSGTIDHGGMKKHLLVLSLLGILTSCGGSSSSSSKSSPSRAPSETISPLKVDEYLELVNAHRKRLGLRVLESTPVIQEVAEEHSKNMAMGYQRFGHNGWKLRCQEVKASLGGGNMCGEIVAWGQKTPRAVFNAWLGSRSHRLTIEGNRYTHTGLGFMRSRSGEIYWTQIFLELE